MIRYGVVKCDLHGQGEGRGGLGEGLYILVLYDVMMFRGCYISSVTT